MDMCDHVYWRMSSKERGDVEPQGRAAYYFLRFFVIIINIAGGFMEEPIPYAV